MTAPTTRPAWTTRVPDTLALADRARAADGRWVRVRADQHVPGLHSAICHDRVPDLPAREFAARLVSGVSLLGPRLDLEVRLRSGSSQ
ncbi:hypothetical protein AB0M43_37760 [Longispora sp. NPDC051575]|uniref:hypothetical protein n=1 Tax=Longispora sp. NPDC051575 TaxID=3154943 RepID=UPI00342DB142